MTTNANVTAPTQTDIDTATYVAFTRNGRNRHATARELGVSPSTVTARVNRHLAHADDALDPRTHALPVIPDATDATDAPGTALAVIPVDVPDTITDDEIVDGEIVDEDAPADAADAPDAPADDAPADAPRRPRHSHCALCGFPFNRARARGICRAVNACARRAAGRAADAAAAAGADDDTDAVDAAVTAVYETHAAYVG